MRIYKRIIIVLVVIVSTFLIHTIDTKMPDIQTAFFNPIAQVEYVDLRKCANRNVLATDLEDIEDIVIVRSIENDSIVVRVENKERFISLNATYPIKNFEINTNNNDIDIKGTVDFENAIYEQETKVKKPYVYIIIDVVLFGYCIFIGYSLLYTLPEMIIDFIKFRKKYKSE